MSKKSLLIVASLAYDGIETKENKVEHKIKFYWVKGHNNDFYNERCDFLANLAAKNSNLIDDRGYLKNQN